VLGRDGAGETSPDLDRVTARLRMLLEETTAYRAHFVQAEKETLVQLC
jgi:hypothetical protein